MQDIYELRGGLTQLNNTTELGNTLQLQGAEFLLKHASKLNQSTCALRMPQWSTRVSIATKNAHFSECLVHQQMYNETKHEHERVTISLATKIGRMHPPQVLPNCGTWSGNMPWWVSPSKPEAWNLRKADSTDVVGGSSWQQQFWAFMKSISSLGMRHPNQIPQFVLFLFLQMSLAASRNSRPSFDGSCGTVGVLKF